MIRRQPKTIGQYLKRIRHHPNVIVGSILCIGIIYTLVVFFSTSLDSMSTWQRILPGCLVVLGLLLTTALSQSKTVGFHWIAFFEDFGKKSIVSSLSIINRVGVFPVALTVYLCYLLLDQTQFMNLHLHPVFLSLDEQFLMIVTLISGVGLVAYEDAEKEYQYSRTGWSQTYQMLGLSMVLSGVTGLILVEQVSELGWIGLVIANIAMVLVFLVGVMLMDEEE